MEDGGDTVACRVSPSCPIASRQVTARPDSRSPIVVTNAVQSAAIQRLAADDRGRGRYLHGHVSDIATGRTRCARPGTTIGVTCSGVETLSKAISSFVCYFGHRVWAGSPDPIGGSKADRDKMVPITSPSGSLRGRMRRALGFEHSRRTRSVRSLRAWMRC